MKNSLFMRLRKAFALIICQELNRIGGIMAYLVCSCVTMARSMTLEGMTTYDVRNKFLSHIIIDRGISWQHFGMTLARFGLHTSNKGDRVWHKAPSCRVDNHEPW
jgi:hypothetical protein